MPFIWVGPAQEYAARPLGLDVRIWRGWRSGMRMQAMELDVDVLRQGIDGPRCRLVPLHESHTEHVVAWRNAPDIAKWFVTQARFSVAAHRQWLVARANSRTDFNWLIESSEGEPVGMVAIYAVDAASRSAEFGRLVIGDPKHRRGGYAREATNLAVSLAREAGLSSLTLEVKSDNEAAIGLYRQIGFHAAGERGGLLVMRCELQPSSREGGEKA